MMLLRKKFMVFLVGMLMLNFLACKSKEQVVFFSAELSADPGPVIEVGRTAKITVIGQNFPEGLSYEWLADDGACNPQKSGKNETIYQAPASIGDLPEKQVKVTVEFHLDGVKRGEESISLAVKRPIDTLASDSPQPTAGIPPTPTPAGPPRVEITKPGEFDPRGERLAEDTIEGRVYGVDPKDYRIILYSLAGGEWWIQPYADGDGRFTEIGRNLNFSNTYHVGVKYAALLCKRSFANPPTRTGTLPLNNENVVAFSIVDGAKK